MRAWFVAVVLVAACSGKDKDSDKAFAAEAAKVAASAPKVTVATVLAKDVGKPPFLYLVDDAGLVRLGAANSWADLDANKFRIASRAGPLERVGRFVRAEEALGIDRDEAVKAWDELAAGEIDLAALEETARSRGVDQDDPPPVEEEDQPDDGAAESGGTGTSPTLDEERRRKQESGRAEGLPKMRMNEDDPQIARQRAIEQTRAAGHRGSYGTLPYAAPVEPLPHEDGRPTRVARVAGLVAPGGKLDRLRVMIVIAPTAKATKLIALLHATDAAVAVSHDGKLRPLHLQFWSREADLPAPWLEARVTANSLVIEAVPDTPIEVTAVDAKLLAAAIDRARTVRGRENSTPVDVLVDGDLDVQHLIDVVVALDLAGVRVIGMGSMPSAEQLARRGHRIPIAAFGMPNAQGDLDKALIRSVVKSSRSKITACYATALETNPALAGTVQVQFFIKPDGTVATASASGLDPVVASCVAGVIKGLAFPKPKGGGGVQVNYPFTMRP